MNTESPTYRAHCRTFALAQTLPVDFTKIRFRRECRDVAARRARNATAHAARRHRAAGAAWPAPSSIVTRL
jgi:hypothetical protein